jgi:hypothetical protein
MPKREMQPCRWNAPARWPRRRGASSRAPSRALRTATHRCRLPHAAPEFGRHLSERAGRGSTAERLQEI